jgi:hypothetical protein
MYRKSKHTYYTQKLSFKKRVVYDVTWQNIVESDTPQMAAWRMRIACCVTKATDTHLQYVIRIAFSLQQWLHESAPILLYTKTVCLVSLKRGAVHNVQH